MNHLKLSSWNKEILFWALLLAITAAGMSFLFLSTSPWGVGASNDSIGYIGGAREILKGHGYRSPISAGPITRWPPLYSLGLAFLGLFGWDPLDGARILNLLLFGLNIFLVGFILKKITKSTTTSLIGSFLMVTSEGMIMIHAMAWSEPLFIFLGITGLFFLTQYLDQEQKPLLFLSAGLVALACLARYGGMAFIGAGALTLLLFGSKNLLTRLIDFVLFTGLSALPLGLWFLRNHLTAKNLTDLNHAFHPPTAAFFESVLLLLAEWFVPKEISKSLRLPGLMLFSTVVAILLISVFAKKIAGQTIHHLKTSQTFRFSFSLTIFALSYLTLLIVHRTFSDTAIKASIRYFSPMFAAMLLASLILFQRFLTLYPRSIFPKIMTVGLFGLISYSYLNVSSYWYSKLYKQGIQFTSYKWRNSETIAKIRNLPENTLIYSNFPTPIYFLTDQPARRLPKKYDDEHTSPRELDKTIPDYIDRLQKIKHSLKSKKGYVILLDDKKRWFQIPVAELKKHLSLVLVERVYDGEIYKTGAS